MAKSIKLGKTTIHAGTRVFEINGIPANSSGFDLVAGRNASWLKSGEMFTVTTEFSPDGKVCRHWGTSTIAGGPGIDRLGNPKSTWNMEGKWPGETDESGNRRRVAPKALRVTLIVPQAFSIESLNFRAV